MTLPARSVAIVTPSYSADFERCVLLCESIDRHVRGVADHFILVDDEDYPLFRPLAGRNRHVINVEDILPSWLHAVRPAFPRNSRKLWLSRRTWPMRGWHVQQLRRIAIGFHIAHEGMLYCDSDMMFVRPFDAAGLWRGEKLRLYRKDGGIGRALPDGGQKHMAWVRMAARLNGVRYPGFPADDYINNLVSWHRTAVIAMCGHIERVTGRQWAAAIGAYRTFSECQIYGAYCDAVLGDKAPHWHSPKALCKTYWSGEGLGSRELAEFRRTMSDGQVAIGVQSFTGTDPAVLRTLLTEAA